MRTVDVAAVGAAAIIMTVFCSGVVAASQHVPRGVTYQRINKQATAYTTVRAAGTSAWQPVNWYATNRTKSQPVAQPISVDAMGVVTVTFSAGFSGGPVDIRVLANRGRRVMRPGAAHFDPRDGANSFSFTFTRSGGRAVCGRDISVQWRRSSSRQAVMNRAGAVVTYQQAVAHHEGCT
jgi:hypothetical protein